MSSAPLYIALYIAQLILQPFRHFMYVTAHSPTLPLLHLHHGSFSNPSVASPTSQLILQSFFCFPYVRGSSLTSPGELPMVCLAVVNGYSSIQNILSWLVLRSCFSFINYTTNNLFIYRIFVRIIQNFGFAGFGLQRLYCIHITVNQYFWENPNQITNLLDYKLTSWLRSYNMHINIFLLSSS